MCSSSTVSLSTPTEVKIRLENHHHHRHTKSPFDEDSRYSPVIEHPSSAQAQDTNNNNTTSSSYQGDVAANCGNNDTVKHRRIEESKTKSSSTSSASSSSSSLCSSAPSSPSVAAPSTPVIRPAPSEERIAGPGGKFSMTSTITATQAVSTTEASSVSSILPQRGQSIKWDFPTQQNYAPIYHKGKPDVRESKITTSTGTSHVNPTTTTSTSTTESRSCVGAQGKSQFETSYGESTSKSNADNGEELVNQTLTSTDIGLLPTDKLIEMLTILLDKIVHSNDRLDDQDSKTETAEAAAANREEFINDPNSTDDPKYTEIVNSVLSFRGKHIPQISIEQYFHRIQKYCPTTNDIYLSLLIYFDRISKKCNHHIIQKYDSGVQQQLAKSGDIDVESASNGIEKFAETNSPYLLTKNEAICIWSGVEEELEKGSIDSRDGERDKHIFVMDSYNIHRLIIAGITVSTKFLSDFFYSNSRYARVGGISLKEMNHLELQFLILCDFELLISVEEMERYANLLHRFWSNNNNNNNNSNKHVNGNDQ